MTTLEVSHQGARPARMRRLRAEGDDFNLWIRASSDLRLNAQDRHLLSVLIRFGHPSQPSVVWPSNELLCEKLGLRDEHDLGHAQIRRSLRRLDQFGYLCRFNPHEFDRWFSGQTIIDKYPQFRHTPHRLIVLGVASPKAAATDEKAPTCSTRQVEIGTGGADVAQCAAPCVAHARRGRPQECNCSGGADVAQCAAPCVAHARRGRPLPHISLPVFPENNVNVNAAAPGGTPEETTPEATSLPARSVDQVRAELVRKRTQWRHPIMVADLIWELLDLGGELPDALKTRPLPPRPAISSDPDSAPAPVAGAAPTAQDAPQQRPGASNGNPPPSAPASRPAGREYVESLIQALRKPGADDAAVEKAAEYLCESLNDVHSYRFHRKCMVDVRSGKLPVKVVIGVLKSVRDAPLESKGRIYTSTLNNFRKGGTL